MTMAMMSTNMVAVASSAPAVTMQSRLGTGSANVVSMASLRSSYAGASLKLRNAAAPVYSRSSVVGVRMESPPPVQTGKGGPQPPSSPPGLGGTEVPLGVITTSSPLEQGNKKPVSERIAYICQDCGYVYDQETPFEDLSESFNCPVCTAPKNRFVVSNSTVGETLDTTKSDN